jgi:hypothetical protein
MTIRFSLLYHRRCGAMIPFGKAAFNRQLALCRCFLGNGAKKPHLAGI